MRFYFILILVGLASQQLWSQRLYNFTVEDGLPSSECYDVAQDSTGFIWVATDRGIARFDNHEWIVFDQSNGLKESTVFRLYPKGDTIWFFTVNNYVQYIFNKKVYTPEFSEELKLLVDSSSGRIASLRINDGKIEFYCIQGLYQNNSGFAFEVCSKKILKHKITDRDCKIIISAKPYPAWGIYSFHLVDSFNVSIRNLPKSEKLDFRILLDKNRRVMSGVNYLQIDFGKFLLSYQNRIYLFQNDRVLDCIVLEKDLIDGSLHSLGDNMYMIGIDSDDPIIFHLSNENIEIHKYIYNFKNLSGGIIDHEGGHWMTCLNQGVHYEPCFGSQYLPEIIGDIKGVFSDSEKTYISTWDSLYILSKLNHLIKDKLPLASQSRLSISSRTYLKTVSQVPRGWRTNQYIVNDTLYSMQYNGFSVYVNDTFKFHSQSLNFNRKVFDMVKFNNSIYCSTVDGLIKIKLPEINVKSPSSNNKIFTQKATGIAEIQDILLVSTFNFGLYAVDKNDSVIFTLNKSNGLPTDKINSINKISNTEVLLGTNHGIIQLIWNDQNDSQYPEIRNYNISHGLESNEIYFLTRDSLYWYYSSNRGFHTYNVNRLRTNTCPPPVIILQKSKNEGQENQSKYLFKLKGLTYKYPYTNKFKYSLKFNNKHLESTEIESHSLYFDQLRSGEYIIRISALNNDGVESKTPATASFVVPTPFFQSWQFYSLATILTILLTLLAVKIQNQRKQMQLKIQEELLTLKQQALSAQMNPHFIFNAMSSIQHLVISQNIAKAESYLTKFAKLTRQILEHSSKPEIPLQLELDRVEKYVEIENLRHNNLVSLHIRISEKVSLLNLLVPSMMIQTLVENAILHGILPSQQKGVVEILGDIEGNLLHLQIVDNGIGIDASQNQKNSYLGEKGSKGIAITQERISSYRKLYGNDEIRILFEDLSNFEQHKTGTRIHIYLPIIKFNSTGK